ncbi:MAG: hypothetical protein WAO76_05230 [Georgfuchsia sp.]
MAAADLSHGAIPYKSDLGDAFHQLSTHGLIREEDGRYTLTPDAQKIMASQRRKTDTPALIAGIKEALYAYEPVIECAAVLLTEKELSEAIAAHRSSAQGAGRNLLMPKNKEPESRYQRAMQRGRPTTARKRNG